MLFVTFNQIDSECNTIQLFDDDLKILHRNTDLTIIRLKLNAKKVYLKV
jgi:hypothetical protein